MCVCRAAGGCPPCIFNSDATRRRDCVKCLLSLKGDALPGELAFRRSACLCVCVLRCGWASPRATAPRVNEGPGQCQSMRCTSTLRGWQGKGPPARLFEQREFRAPEESHALRCGCFHPTKAALICALHPVLQIPCAGPCTDCLSAPDYDKCVACRTNKGVSHIASAAGRRARGRLQTPPDRACAPAVPVHLVPCPQPC